LKLKRIAENRDDAAEEEAVGRSLKELPQEKWPCCVEERVGFMAPFEYTKTKNRPYNRGPIALTDTSRQLHCGTRHTRQRPSRSRGC
jgi:hypothetical protein